MYVGGVNMAYFNECPLCGATLDPGERCDCEQLEEAREKEFETMTHCDDNGQITFNMGGMRNAKVS